MKHLRKNVKRFLAERKRSRARSALKRVASRGVRIDSFIDVGASDGRWSQEAMDYFPGASYLLVEANASHEDALQSFCREHKNASYVMIAASDRNGEIKFSAEDDDSFSGCVNAESPGVSVPARPLDEVVKELQMSGPYGLKLDTHGHEVPILNGAEGILKSAELVTIECYLFRLTDETLLVHEMIDFMRERGFGVVDMSDPLWRPQDKYLWQLDPYFQRLESAGLDSTSFK